MQHFKVINFFNLLNFKISKSNIEYINIFVYFIQQIFNILVILHMLNFLGTNEYLFNFLIF